MSQDLERNADLFQTDGRHDWLYQDGSIKPQQVVCMACSYLIRTHPEQDYVEEICGSAAGWVCRDRAECDRRWAKIKAGGRVEVSDDFYDE